MGDFNRRFRQFGAEDQFWLALSEDGPSQPRLVAHPISVTRLCPTRLGGSTQPIDFIMLPDGLAHRYRPGSYWETRYSYADVEAHGGPSASRLSDHCPVRIDLLY